MTAPTDHELIVELRALTDAAVPEMSLDGPAVHAAGRRRARARRWAAAGAGVTAVVAAAVMVGSAPQMFAPTPALSPAVQRPTVADETVTTLATGATAATAVIGSGSPWSTDLTVTLPTGTLALSLLAGTQADREEALDGTGVRADHALRFVFTGAGAPTDSVLIAWADEQQAPAVGDRQSDPSARTMFHAGSSDGTGITRIMAGVVPSWLPGARVVLFSAEGMTDPSGTRVHAVEVPTFADPTGSGARVYVVVTDPRVPPGQQPVRGIVYVAPDGTFVDADGTCALSSAVCAGPRPGGLDLRSELLSVIEP